MDVTQVAQRYFDAWKHRDAAAIVAAFTERGTYSDPVAGQGLTGEVLITYAKEMWGAFPDLSYEILTLTTAGRDTVAAQWLMRGTNTGSFKALLPTNRSISVRGVEFIWIRGRQKMHSAGLFRFKRGSRAVGAAGSGAASRHWPICVSHLQLGTNRQAQQTGSFFYYRASGA